MNALQKKSNSVILGALAFIIYGSWAIFSNWEYGLKKSLTAGMTQGLMSFLITTFIAFLMIWLFDQGRSHLMRFLYAVGGTNAVAITGMVVAHLIVGTPDILQTILPSMIVGFAMTVSYSIARLRQEAKHRKPDSI